MTAAIMKLPLSLTRLASRGRSDTLKTFCPIASNSGPTRCIARFSPAATTNSDPAAATFGRPKTGAATKS